LGGLCPRKPIGPRGGEAGPRVHPNPTKAPKVFVKTPLGFVFGSQTGPIPKTRKRKKRGKKDQKTGVTSPPEPQQNANPFFVKPDTDWGGKNTPKVGLGVGVGWGVIPLGQQGPTPPPPPPPAPQPNKSMWVVKKEESWGGKKNVCNNPAKVLTNRGTGSQTNPREQKRGREKGGKKDTLVPGPRP